MDPFNRTRLLEPVDNRPLVVFRILFGLLVFVECAGAILTGWVHRVFVEPRFTFPFIGFEWLQPLPGQGMVGYYLVMASLGLLIAVGLCYRPAVIAFTVLWSITFLMQKASYNNHYYLLALLGLMMCVVPAQRRLSLDARRRPELAAAACPRWCIAIFVAQQAVVYGFAALAKLHPDWIAGRPVAIWFAERADYPWIGPLYEQAWLQRTVVHGGILFDLLIVPLMLWRRSRPGALALAVVFHLFNSITFGIGIFPYLALALLVFFFPGPTPRASIPPPTRPRLTLALLGLFLLFQVLMPLRHWCFPGDVNWTEEGHRLSWRMMTRTKTGWVHYRLRDRSTGDEWTLKPRDLLTPKQTGSLATHPDMIWQLARRLAREAAARGRQVEVYARGGVSLNGRRFQPQVDPQADLAAVEWSRFRHSPWITQLKE